MTYSWHKEFYNKAQRKMENEAKKMMIAAGEECTPIGWTAFFGEHYSEPYKKYLDAVEKIEKRWGDMDPQAMEAWKTAVKHESEAILWILGKYLEHQKNEMENERLKGRQECLV